MAGLWPWFYQGLENIVAQEKKEHSCRVVVRRQRPVSALVRQLQNDSAVKRHVSGEWAGIYRCGTAFDVMSGDHRAQCCACEDHNFESDCEVMNLLAHNTRLLIVWLRRRGFGGREALRCGV